MHRVFIRSDAAFELSKNHLVEVCRDCNRRWQKAMTGCSCGASLVVLVAYWAYRGYTWMRLPRGYIRARLRAAA